MLGQGAILRPLLMSPNGYLLTLRLGGRHVRLFTDLRHQGRDVRFLESCVCVSTGSCHLTSGLVSAAYGPLADYYTLVMARRA